MDEIERKIYDIVLAARTEGIVGGKTKWLAKGDTDDILDIPITVDGGVCPNCVGNSYLVSPPSNCPACNGTGKKSKTIRNLIEEYLEG